MTPKKTGHNAGWLSRASRTTTSLTECRSCLPLSPTKSLVYLGWLAGRPACRPPPFLSWDLG